MKLEVVLLARAVRLIRINQPPGSVHMPKLIGALQERYSFLKVPTTLQEYDLSKGIEHLHGKFQIKKEEGAKEIVIDSFKVYENGLVADTTSSAADSDAFLDDVIQWGVSTFGLTIPENQTIKKHYVSNIEVSSAHRLNEYCPASSLLSKRIAKHLRDYGVDTPVYEVTGIILYFDKTNQSMANNFSLERRAGVPFSSNLYFSSAPLETADHLAVLEELEQTLKK